MKNESDPIRLSYFLRIRNAGDRLNANIVSEIAGRPTQYVSTRSAPHVLAAGSILAGSNAHSAVWGAGLKHPDLGLGRAQPKNIHLLRGKETFAALRKAGLNLGDIPLGDPLFLAAGLLNISRAAVSTGKIGIMAHYLDRQSRHIHRLLQYHNVIDLNVHGDPVSLVEQVAECDAIVSTCLHGLVLAESLGIPNLWARTEQIPVGDGFEFRDWYSLCRTSQKVPWVLGATDTPDGLSVACRINEPDIVAADLRAAFPHDRIAEFEQTGLSRPLIPLAACRSKPVPVFVISFNRGRMIQNLFASLNTLDRAVDVIIHDNGSDDPNAIEALELLAEQGARIVRRQKISDADELDNVNETVQDYFSNWSEPQNYVVTDCDISVSPCDADILDVLAALLDRFSGIGCAGPMLRIHDISKNNPLYGHILTAHIRQFWGKLPTFVDLGGKAVGYQESPIDTTLAMHRAGEPFKRLKTGVRTYEPYEARHLDWYEEEQEENYRDTSNPNVSHWGNRSFINQLSEPKLPFEHFFRVHRSENQALRVEKVRVDGEGGVAGAADTDHRQIRKKLRQTEKNLTAKNALLEKVKAERAAAVAELNTLKNSTSWKITAALRLIRNGSRRGK